MTEKRFDVGNLKIQDNAPKGRAYLLDMQGGVNALCSLINGLNDKSNRLEKENEQLKSENIQLTVDNKELKCTNNELYQENEQLKQLVNIADDLIDKLGSETMQNEWIKNF